jgi:uncharacterized phage infection (PIP) family protein YhgE
LFNQLASTQEEYDAIIEKLEEQLRAKATPSKSVKKAQMDKASTMLDELLDKVEEAEDEMVRMREEHSKQLEAMKQEHLDRIQSLEAQLKSKIDEFESLKESHAQEVQSHENETAALKEQVMALRQEVGQIRRSKEELVERYERIIREDADPAMEEEDEGVVVHVHDARGEAVTEATKPRRAGPRSRTSKVACDAENLPSTTHKQKTTTITTATTRMPFGNLVNSNDDDDDIELLYPPKLADLDETTGEYKKPRGRPPQGREWDGTRGAWRNSIMPTAN